MKGWQEKVRIEWESAKLKLPGSQTELNMIVVIKDKYWGSS